MTILKIDDVAVVHPPGTQPCYSPNGYVIAADGTVYALQYKYYHGIVCAILFPDLAKQFKYAPPVEPREALSVREYQNFELDHHNRMDLIRMTISITGDLYFSKGNAEATASQIEAFIACANLLGCKGRSKIETSYGPLTLAQIVEKLRTSTDYELIDTPNPRTSTGY